jgi:hypothetical protein
MKNKTKILDNSKSFNLTWEALKANQNQLKQQGKGNKPKRACLLTDEEINILVSFYFILSVCI